jgi:sugar diacid utilization regulator
VEHASSLAIRSLPSAGDAVKERGQDLLICGWDHNRDPQVALTVADFSTDWLAATMLPHMDRLQPLTNAGRAREQSHLRDAVHAYSRHGFSITASAGALHIHPNTMKYRLDRWQQLTGWDPRTLDGLLRSLFSITFPPGQTPGRP